jgi:hypothetical protein
VYVIFLEQRYESFLPGFDVVEKDVMEAARAEAVNKELAKQTLDIQNAVTEALAAGTSFPDAVKPYSLTAVVTPEFDLSSELDDPYADRLVPASLNIAQGRLCQPVPVDGGVLLVYVAERITADAAVGLPALRDQLVSGLAGARARRMAADWQGALMREADLRLNQK